MSWSSFAVDGALGILATPLVAAGLAKLLAGPQRLPWPHLTGLLAEPHGPRLVGAAEVVAALAILLAPGWAAAALAASAYTALALIAYRLRGQRCACFGVARLAAVGRGHVTANVAAVALAVALVPLAGPAAPIPRMVALAPAAVALGGFLRWLDRRTAAKTVQAPCADVIRGVRVYVSADCPACRSLRALLARSSEIRRAAVEVVVVRGEDELPLVVQSLPVPSATALDAGGHVVCSPVTGVGDVKALVDRMVLGVVGHANVG